MRGAYCLLIGLEHDAEIGVGALGARKFPRGLYVYIGSAQSGIGARVGRHVSGTGRKHWHVDYLLEHATVLSMVALQVSSKEDECLVAQSLLSLDGAEVVVDGFGSSDCSCRSHLVYFDTDDYDRLTEMLSSRLCMLPTVYPETVD
jgi:Uri superfamily endonuclease